MAWIPYGWSLWAASIHRRYPRRRWSLLLPGALWLLFLPNAPYIVTDFLHLRERPPVPLWYDTGMLMAFAWAGCFLGIASLDLMHRIVKDFLGQARSWLFVLAVVGLSGLGIYLGRFLNWNSWDLFLFPQEVLGDLGSRLIHPLSNLQTYGVTFVFAALLFAAYWMFTSVRQHDRI